MPERLMAVRTPLDLEALGLAQVLLVEGGGQLT
jgi:hypothetical protein